MGRWATTLACAAVAIFAVGCGSDDDKGSEAKATTNEPIVIGAAYSKSGLGAAFDTPAFNAAQMAVDDINANGGLLGRQIKVVSADTRSDLDQSKAAAEDVIRQGAEMVLAPCDYDLGSPAALAAQSKKLISFSLCSGSPKWGVQGIGDMSYSPAVSAVAEGYVYADYAFKNKGWKTAVEFLDLSLSYNKSVCDGFNRRYKELGGKVLDRVTFPGGGKTGSLDAQLSKIRSAKPDVVMLCTYPPGGPTALRQMRAAGIDVPVISDASMDGSYWLEAVPDLSDFYFGAFASIFGDDPNKDVNAFMENYEKKFGEQPSTAYALNGYVAVQMYADAVERAGTTDPEAVRKALDEANDVPTLLGPTSYSAENHISLKRPLAMVEVVNGKPKFEGYAKTEGDPPLFLGDE